MYPETTPLHIRVLGSLSAHLDRRPVTPSAGKQRQILALLALNCGRIVTVRTIVDELWGDDPPRSSGTTLQTYILQLRNRLAGAVTPGGQDARQILGTRHGGYILDGPSCQTDVTDFERLARAGRAAIEAKENRTASELLGQALAMWHGSALSDVPTGRVLELEAISLEETRLGVLGRRIEADLALGRHADMIGELRMLTAKTPMDEKLCQFLITALYRAGHADRALQEYQRLRAVLREELGIEPCPRLQHMQQAVLSRDPSLDVDGYAMLLASARQHGPDAE